MKLVISILLTLLLALSAKGLDPSVNISDSGFRPEVNGFSFENYGNETPTVGLTQIEMQRMFGERVCSSTTDGKCILSPPARVWMEEANKAMDYGHCEGMAVLSILMYNNQTPPSRFGGSEADMLSLQNEPLQREIAYWWATQVTTPGRSRKVNDSANAVLDTLFREFKDGRKATEWWTLGLYQPDGYGGHAITPYAVENMSNGSARILVYDNNFPKITRSVEIDRIANTWKYHTSVNPNEASELYAGNASTKSLEVVSIPPRMAVQNCEFCDDTGSFGLGNTKGSLGGQSRIQFWVDGSAKLLITDANGQRTGFLDSGQFINEIPSAESIELRFLENPGSVQHEPVLMVPAGDQISAQLTGTGGSSNSDLTGIGSYYYFRVEGAALKPGETIYLVSKTAGNEYAVEFTATKFESTKYVNLVMGVNTPDKSYEFEIIGVKFDALGSLVLHYDPVANTFTSETIGNANPGQFYSQITVTDKATGTQQIIANNDIKQETGNKITLYLNSYDGNSIAAEVQIGDVKTQMTLQDNPGLHIESEENPAGTQTQDGSVPPGQNTGGSPIIPPTIPPSDYKLTVYVNHWAYEIQ